MRNLQPADLEYFIEICKQGSLAQASICLGVTQPALSKAIKRLESLIGSPLLDRKATGVAPTKIGHELMRRSHTILNELQTAQSVLQEMSGARLGTVAIGTPPTLGYQFIPDIMRLALELRPKLHFRISDGLYDDLLPRLMHGQLDFIISTPPSIQGVSSDLQWESLGCTQFDACTAYDHPLFKKRPIEESNLLKQPWVLATRGGILRDTLDTLFKQKGFEPPSPQIESNSPNLSKALVMQQQFIAYLPVEIIEDDVKAQRIRRLHMPWLAWQREFFLISRRWHSLSPAAQFVVDLIRQESALRFSPVARP